MKVYIKKLIEVPMYICDRCRAEVEDIPIKICIKTSDPEWNDCVEYHFCCKECFISFMRSPEVERLIECASYEKGSFVGKSLTIKLKNPERVLLEKLLKEGKK